MRKAELAAARQTFNQSANNLAAGLNQVKTLLRNYTIRKKFKTLQENLSTQKLVFFSEKIATDWVDKIIIGVTSGFFTKPDLQKIQTFLNEVLNND